MCFPRADDVVLTNAIRHYVVAGDGEIKRYRYSRVRLTQTSA